MQVITKEKIGKLLINLYRNGSYYSINQLKQSGYKFDNRTLKKHGKGLLKFSKKYNKYGKSRQLVCLSEKSKKKIEDNISGLSFLANYGFYFLIFDLIKG